VVLDWSSRYNHGLLRKDDLPENFDLMSVTHQSDAIRMALLARYGGVWMDPMIICLRPLDAFVHHALTVEAKAFGGFYLSSRGSEMHVTKDYVENWFMAVRRGRGSDLMRRWQSIFNRYFESRGKAVDKDSIVMDMYGLKGHYMFEDVDLEHLSRFTDLSNWLVMHAAFKKLIEIDMEMRDLWENEMLLLRADDTALWHLQEIGYDTERGKEKWLGDADEDWVSYVLSKCPILKFRGCEGNALSRADVGKTRLLDARTCLGRVFRAALKADELRGLEHFLIAELRGELKRRCLPSSGKRSELVKRLEAAGVFSLPKASSLDSSGTH